MRRAPVLIACTAAVLLAAGCAVQPGGTVRISAQATQASPPDKTIGGTDGKPCPGYDLARAKAQPLPQVSGTPMNTPQAEALAQALNPRGDRTFADVFGTLVVDSPPGRVLLCVTDLDQGRKLAAAAKKEHPGIDLTRLDIDQCRYSQRTLDAAISRLTKAVGFKAAGFPLYSWSPTSDSSGITVTTTKPGAASKALQQKLTALSGGIPVTVALGSAVVAEEKDARPLLGPRILVPSAYL